MKKYVFIIFVLMVSQIVMAQTSRRLWNGNADITGTFQANVINATGDITGDQILAATMVINGTPFNIINPASGTVPMFDSDIPAFVAKFPNNATPLNSLDDIPDVSVTNKVVGDALKWNAGANIWEASDDVGLTSVATTIITDISQANKSVGQVFKWNAGANIWEASDDIGLPSVATTIITDISQANKSVGQVLKWNADESIWEASQDLTGLESVAMGDITDVSEIEKIVGQVLKWNAGASIWEASNDISGGPGYTAMEDITNVSAANKSNTQVLKWNAGESIWEASDDVSGGPGSVAMEDITNVSATNKSNTQVLKWNADATIWEASDDISGGGGASALNDLTDVVLTGPSTNEVLKYNGSEWINSTATGSWHAAETIIIAATDSSNSIYADYICDGTADNLEIQAAINSLGKRGGTVKLLEGTFNLNSIIRLATPNINLVGSGFSTALIATSTPGSTTPGIICVDWDSTLMAGCLLKDFKLIGNTAWRTNAYYFGIDVSRAYYTVVDHVWTENFNQGFSSPDAGQLTPVLWQNCYAYACTTGYMADTTKRNSYINCVAISCITTGFNVIGVSEETSLINCLAVGAVDGFVVGNTNANVYISLSNCMAYGNSANGFELDGFTTSTGCTSRNNTNDGFQITGDFNQLTGCVAKDNTGIGIATTTGSDNITINSCVSYSNTEEGITIINGKYNSIQNNYVYSNTLAGIRIWDGADYTFVIGNYIYNNSLSGIEIGDNSLSINTCLLNNYILNNGAATNTAAIDIQNSTGTLIANNVISDDVGTSPGIYYDDYSTSPSTGYINGNKFGPGLVQPYIQSGQTGKMNWINQPLANDVLIASSSPTSKVGYATETEILNVITVSSGAPTNPIATSWDLWSDPGLKENIREVGYLNFVMPPTEQSGLEMVGPEKIAKVKLIKFDWRVGQEPVETDYVDQPEEYTKAHAYWVQAKTNPNRKDQFGVDIKDPDFPDQLKSYNENGKVTGVNMSQLLMMLQYNQESILQRLSVLEAAILK